MLASFTSRIIGGVVAFGVLSLLLYSFLYYNPDTLPGALLGERADEWKSDFGPIFDIEDYELNKPWPLSYFAWLFDPEDTLSPVTYDLEGNTIERVPIGVDISIGLLRIKGSGALTGDLGPSLLIGLGTPVSDMFGPGIGELFAFLSTLIAALMALVAAQRWRRPQPYRVSTLPTTSALVDWWHLHSRSPIDVAIIRRQWA